MNEPRRKGIPPKQRLFIEAYLCNGFNATRAAITAGYSERSARQIGARLLTNDDVKAEIEIYLAEITLSREEILTRLADLARADFADLLTVSTLKKPVPLAERTQSEEEDGEAAPEFLTIEEAALDLVKAMKASKTYAIESIENGKYGLKVKLHDKLKALELAGRAKGLWLDKVEHTGKDGGPVVLKVVYGDDGTDGQAA